MRLFNLLALVMKEVDSSEILKTNGYLNREGRPKRISDMPRGIWYRRCMRSVF